MAENEDLDLWGRHSGRWRRLHRLIKSSSADEDIQDAVVRCLYGTFKKIGDDVHLGEACKAAAAGNGDLIRETWETRKHGDYLEQFRLAGKLTGDPAVVAVLVVKNVADRFSDQIGMELVKSGVFAGFPEWEKKRGRWMTSIEGRIERLAKSIAQHPNKALRMPRRSAADRKRDQRELQQMSLLPSGTGG